MPNWTPKQQDFLDNATKRYNLKGGARRSGKTYLDYFVIPRRIRRMAELDGLVYLLGHTKQTLQTNIIEPLQKMYGTGLVTDIKSNNTAIMFGERVNCIGTDNVGQAFKVKGSSMKYLYCDEIVTFPEPVFTEFLGCLDKSYSTMDATFNPSFPGHYIERFIQNNPDSCFSQKYTIYDNTYLDDEVVKSLEEAYGPEGSVWWNRYILGEWCKAEGLIYPMFNKDIHVVENIDRNYRKYWISADYGVQNATSFGLWGLADDGIYYRIDEYYHSGRNTNIQKTVGEYYEELVKLAGDRDIECVICDPAAASFIIEIRKRGKFTVRNANNQVLDKPGQSGGISACATALLEQKIKFNENCKNCIREVGLYAWDDKSLEDKPLKVDDHCLSGNTMVDTINGQIQINKLVGKSGELYCVDKNNNKTIGKFHNVRLTQKKQPVYMITMVDDRKIKSTADHKVMTQRGWVELGKLEITDKIRDIHNEHA